MASPEVIAKIRENLTPQVTVKSFVGKGERIFVEYQYEYPRAFPFLFAMVFKAVADKEGNILGMGSG